MVLWCYVFILWVKLFGNKEFQILKAKYWPYWPQFFVYISCQASMQMQGNKTQMV